MNTRTETLQLERARPTLNRFALMLVFTMANLIGRFDPNLLAARPGIAKWTIFLSLLTLSALGSLVFVAFCQTAEKSLARSRTNFLTSFLIVACGLFIVVFLIWTVNPLSAKFLGLDFAQQFKNPPLLVVRLLLGAALLTWLFRFETQILARLRFAGSMVKRLEKNQEQLVEAEEQQRTQTSRFLHDRVQAELMVVSLQIANIEKKLAKADAAELATARARLETLRRVDLKLISNALTPNLQDFGLEFSVHELVNQLAAGFEVELQINVDAIRDNAHTKLGIYRIIEQALVNSITHGPASCVKITVGSQSETTCFVTIEDDGPGASSAEIEAGFGTVLIDSWVSILKATKNVTTKPGEGYKLTVTIPL